MSTGRSSEAQKDKKVTRLASGGKETRMRMPIGMSHEAGRLTMASLCGSKYLTIVLWLDEDGVSVRWWQA